MIAEMMKKGVGMWASARAQAAIAIGVPADPSRIAAAFGEVVDALATLGVTRHDPDLQE